VADIGSGFIRMRAGEPIAVMYKASLGQAAVHHVVVDLTPAKIVREHSAIVSSPDVDVFTLDVDSYVLSWSGVVVAKNAKLVIEISVGGEPRYRRERTYSGSGLGPRGEVFIAVDP
jgi:hypothetical protein